MQCTKCGHINVAQIKFCINCGNQLSGDKIDSNDSNKKYFIQSICLFISIVFVIIFSIKGNNTISNLSSEYIFNSVLGFIIVLFLLFDYKNFFKLFYIKFRLKPLIQIFLIAPIFAFVVIIILRYISSITGINSEKYYEFYLYNTSNMYLYGLLFVSILPGLLEEMLFRGLLFNYLLRFTSPKTVILITSILFSFIHFSFFSILWLMIVGIILGYFRFRYRTLWYSILFHSLYNASVFFIEFYV